ncbi:MAG: 30S ribosomal protein S8 [Deltaproteobacteria bacterium]|nr:30S ribosomal protein S8 [Deltaproteobacteria bacterium]
MTDPISDMLTRIRNALIAKHKKVDIPSSRIKIEIADVLKEEGYIKDYNVVEEGYKKIIKMELKYTAAEETVIKEIRRVSRPGRRIYVKSTEIPRIKGGLGTSIVSTSKGIMTGSKARSLRVGGELMCTVL